MSAEPARPRWLTPADLQQEVDRYTFGGLFASAKPKLELVLPDRPWWPPEEFHGASEPVRITLYTVMPDRVTGEPVAVCFSESVPMVYFRDLDMFHKWLRIFLQNAWRHEFNESVRLDGELVVDPHTGDSVAGL
jgi:hypothetical protein